MEYNKTITLKDGRLCLLRNATSSDAKNVLENFNKVHAETDFLLSYPNEKGFSIDEEIEFLKNKQFSSSEIQICSIVNNKIIGLAGISSVGLREKIKHRSELGISIEKEFWGLGIGRALTKACIDCAKSAGYKQIELEVVAENFSAIAMYKNFGFEEYGRNPRGFYSRYTGWQELVLMLLSLDYGNIFNHSGKNLSKMNSKSNRFTVFSCSNVKIKSIYKYKKVLDKTLYEVLRKIAQYSLANKEEFEALVKSSLAKEQTEEVGKQQKRIPQITDRMEQIERVMNKLYEDNALGNIEPKRYEQLSEKYAEEYYSLKAEQEQIEERLSEFENANQRAKNFIKLAESYSDFEELTPTAINEFISKIVVHERDVKRAKYAVQRIEVYFNYIGKFENELTKEIEPTEQEMIQMREEIEEAKKEKSRAYHKVYSKEYRARKKLQATT